MFTFDIDAPAANSMRLVELDYRVDVGMKRFAMVYRFGVKRVSFTVNQSETGFFEGFSFWIKENEEIFIL